MDDKIFMVLDYVIIGLELIALVAFLFFSYQRVSQLFLGGKKDVHSHVDALVHSYFIVTISVVVFHFTTSILVDEVLDMPLGKTDLRQLFYFVTFIMELAFICCVFALHKIRECEFTGMARIVMLLGLVMCVNVMIQYYSHGVQGSDIYNMFYRTVIMFVNIVTLLAISIYPVLGFFKIIK
jgi:hypothetical protein